MNRNPFKSAVFAAIVALLAFAPAAWAQEVQVSTEDGLRNAIANSQAGTTIILDANISITQGELVFDKGMILDLHGRTITANYHIRVTGGWTLQIYDNSESGRGVILGRYLGGDGCAIYIDNGSTLEIFSGTIQGDRNTTYNGGVIYNAGTLMMYGGAITKGYAANGGAVYNTGTMTLAGSTIGGIDESDPENPVSLGNTASSHGGAIYNGGTLTVTGGSISYNTGDDAGAIYNATGKTLTINGGSISNNTSTTYSGGAVVNEGTATIEGGSFNNNTAQVNGGAIYNHGSLTVTGGNIAGNTATNGNGGGIYIHETGGNLTMSGRPTVMGNLAGSNSNNLYLGQSKTVTVGGAFTTGATVGVRTYSNNTNAFTSDYVTNSPDNQAVFSSDNTSFDVTVENNEAKLVSYNPEPIDGPVTYLDMWEDDRGEKQRTVYTKMSTLTDNGVTLSGSTTEGWYVVDKNLTFNKRITISGTVNLILMDNTTLTANKGIFVPSGATLHIWAQSNKMTDPNDLMGIINATANEDRYSGIGGNNVQYAGVLHFHGGMISATGGYKTAGINGAPIIGVGNYSTFIYGGAIFGFGGDYGAGIGGNMWGICGGIKITGGIVMGLGGEKAAGIGTGFRGTMHEREGGFSGNMEDDDVITEIRITGGDVTAWGTEGAGIGGGAYTDQFEGDGAYFVMTGGRVDAMTMDGVPFASLGAMAIGWGLNVKNSEITHVTSTPEPHIPTNAKVSARKGNDGALNLVTRSTWDGNWKYYKNIIIEPCDHPNATYTDALDGQHNITCSYCLKTKEDHVFGGHTCSKCGVSDAIYTVTLASATEGALNGAYTTDPHTLLKGQTLYTLPTETPAAPSGYEFVGWYVGPVTDIVDGGYYLKSSIVSPTLHEAGATVNINADTEIVAVYRLLSSGAVTIAYNGERAEATIDGNYTGSGIVNIPGDISVDTVIFNREFTEGKYSTIVLPFSIKVSEVDGAYFCAIDNIDKVDGKWKTVHGTALGKSATIEANKPYLLNPTKTSITFTGPVTLNTIVKNPYELVKDGIKWEFRGAYNYFVFGQDSAQLLGPDRYAYGFSATNESEAVKVGDFALVGASAKIPALRAYLMYSTVNEPEHAPSLPSTMKAARYAPQASVDADIPENLEVEITYPDEGTTVIGTLNTRTGEIRMKAEDRWFDLQGRVLNGKPTIKGRYLHNGKVEVIR